MQRIVILFTAHAIAGPGILSAGDEKKPPANDDPAAVVETLKLGAKLTTDDDGRLKTLKLTKATDRSLIHLKGLIRSLGFCDPLGFGGSRFRLTAI